jgi:hypothetical protein
MQRRTWHCALKALDPRPARDAAMSLGETPTASMRDADSEANDNAARISRLLRHIPRRAKKSNSAERAACDEEQ